MLQEATNPLAQLELIDPIQRLGMGHIFDKEIKGALNIIWEGHNKNDNKGGLGDNYDLYATSLLFRLLREHGYLMFSISSRDEDEVGLHHKCHEDHQWNF
ncbi:alpha-terpineol synthase isoform X1 [Cinnamomum micranthum f. kanehirae]|uniref:Alpha-terpineol synthase isoform X1 n=1 Tax=Cinnamomum micranthum f. kanehirae TaxID=337451 RepID=A0A443Q537_9MAGN|nr:alpha-terpineol synthase isoform X1 [Cinnamomum micranthum f. kanehirae]